MSPCPIVETIPQREPGTGRFAKGASGNPAGRPRGKKNTFTLLSESISKDDADTVLQIVKEMALKGNKWAVKFLAERLWPAGQITMKEVKALNGLVRSPRRNLRPIPVPSVPRQNAQHVERWEDEPEIDFIPFGAQDDEDDEDSQQAANAVQAIVTANSYLGHGQSGGQQETDLNTGPAVAKMGERQGTADMEARYCASAELPKREADFARSLEGEPRLISPVPLAMDGKTNRDSSQAEAESSAYLREPRLWERDPRWLAERKRLEELRMSGTPLRVYGVHSSPNCGFPDPDMYLEANPNVSGETSSPGGAGLATCVEYVDCQKAEGVEQEPGNVPQSEVSVCNEPVAPV